MLKSIIRAAYFFFRGILISFLRRKPVPSISLRQDADILVIRIDRIGDMVLSTPVFRVLKQHFPRSKITVICRNQAYDIIAHNPYIDKVICYSGALETIVKYRGHYDLVIDLLMDYDIRTALLTYFLDPAFSIGFDINKRGPLFTTPVSFPDERKHFIDYLFELVKPLGINVPDNERHPEIFVDNKTREDVSLWLKENGVIENDLMISVHPGGFYASQRWDWKYYADFINRVFSKYENVKVFLFGTTSFDECDTIRHIRLSVDEKFRSSVFEMIDHKLIWTVYLIKLSKLFVGNNSGIIHIASAVKTPSISSLGPTVPWIWHPYGDRKINVTLRKNLPCSPCNLGKCKGHECLNLITVDEVFEKASLLLEDIYGIKQSK